MAQFFLRVEVEVNDPTVTAEDVAQALHDEYQWALQNASEDDYPDGRRLVVTDVSAAGDR